MIVNYFNLTSAINNFCMCWEFYILPITSLLCFKSLFMWYVKSALDQYSLLFKSDAYTCFLILMCFDLFDNYVC